MFGMKNKLDGVNGRFHIAEETNDDVTAGTHVTRHKEKMKQKISEYGKTSLSVMKNNWHTQEKGENNSWRNNS